VSQLPGPKKTGARTGVGLPRHGGFGVTGLGCSCGRTGPGPSRGINAAGIFVAPSSWACSEQTLSVRVTRVWSNDVVTSRATVTSDEPHPNPVAIHHRACGPRCPGLFGAAPRGPRAQPARSATSGLTSPQMDPIRRRRCRQGPRGSVEAAAKTRRSAFLRRGPEGRNPPRKQMFRRWQTLDRSRPDLPL
jgi:hypothetical protein